MDERHQSKAPTGLPANLLGKDAQGFPRLFSMIPGFNRDIRRWLATSLRSLKRSRDRKSKQSDTDAVIEIFSLPATRRFHFWKEVGDSPPSAGDWTHEHYLSVDFWLLREIEPDLDHLSPADDAAMRQSCPCWDSIRESMIAWSKKSKTVFDSRYFGLWPRLVNSMAGWRDLDEDARCRVVNGAFALSSIAGDPWFVEEAKRLCPAAETYFEGLKPSARVPDGTEGAADEPDRMVSDDHGGSLEATSSRGDWGALGTELRVFGSRLEQGDRDPSIVVDLDRLVGQFEGLKVTCPLTGSERDQLERQLDGLEAFLTEASEGAASGVLDRDRVELICARWRRLAEDTGSCEEAGASLRAQLEQAQSDGRAAELRLHGARLALGEAEDAYRAQQQVERAATGLEERRAARRQFAGIEEKLARLRREEEAAEEEFLTSVGAPEGTRTESAGAGALEERASSGLDAAISAVPPGPSTETTIGDSALQRTKDRLEETLAARVESGLTEDAGNGGAQSVVPPRTIEEPTGSDSDPRFTPATGNTCAPIWQALRVGRVALAHHAAVAIRAIHPNLVLPSPSLLAALALSQRLQSPGGPIAEVLRDHFAQIDRNDFQTGPEPWRLANNLLLLSACLRPLILAPDTGASAVAQYVHLGAGLEPVFEVQRLLSDYGQRLKGNRLDAAALGAIRSRANWDLEFEQLQRDIGQWSERAPRFTVKFKAATDVWRRWIAPDGPLGRLLALIQTSSTGSTRDVRELCELFETTASFRELVDETDRRQLKRHRGEDIHAGAFEQLWQKAGEAALLAERWVSLMEARPSSGDYRSRQLGELQAQLGKAGKSALDALDTFVGNDDWGLTVAARDVLKGTLTGVLELFSGGRIPVAPEQRPEVILGDALLFTGRISLDSKWQLEATPGEVLEAIKAFLVKPGTPVAAADAYTAVGDLMNAQRALDLMGTVGDDREEATRGFERALSRRREEFRQDCGLVEEEISLALAYSLIGEAERSELSSRVAGLEHGPAAQLRFDLCERAVREIRSQLKDRRDSRAAELRQRLDQVVARHPDHDYPIIETAISEGDFPVATEYLHRVEQDPSAGLAPVGARDLFNDFFPERCRQLQQLVEKMDATATRKVIQERLNAAGVTFQQLSRERAAASSDTWTQWSKLKGTRAPTPDMIRVLLQAVGFRNVTVTPNTRSANRIREYSATTAVLTDRDICQIPHFGSRAEGRYRIACLWDPPGQEDYRLLAGDATTEAATIALYFGTMPEQKRRELSVLSRGERRQSFLLIDDLVLLFICGEENSPLGALFQSTLPFTYADPFVTTSSVVPPEMFFGRAEELASIKSMDGRCFVYGGRQLGKTALLRQAEREFHNPAERRIAVWIDLKRLTRPDEIWIPIWRELRKYGIVGDKVAEPRRAERTSRRIDEFVHTLEHWMAGHPEQRVLLLLDEADRFLEFDARDGFPDTRRLKALMELTDRRFKVVFAGLHNVLRTMEQANQPLAHFGEAIEIGPLIRPDDLRAARELILRPLMAAGFTFDNEQRADRVLAITNYYPSLIQLYCSKLLHELLRNGGAGLERRTGPRYLVTARHLDSVYARQDLREEIRSKFLLTLKLDPRYNLITYALAYEMQQGTIRLEEGASVEEIRRVAEAWWKEGFERTPEPAFRVLLQEMVGLGVLRAVDSVRFTLRNPNVLLLLGSPTEISEELVRERELPAEYEPRIHRMALGSDATGRRRSPLTVSQVADVVTATNGVVIVAGSDAAGIRDVQEAVTAATETGFMQLMEPGGAGGVAAFQRTLDRLSDRRSGGTTVLFVGPDCPWSATWVMHACSRLERLKSEKNPVRVVFIADPTTLRVVLGEDLPRSVQVVSLEPWSVPFLREWLQETNQPTDGAVRDSLLEQSGGWPEFVYEWQPDASSTIDTAGEAQRRLQRLGVEEPHLLSALDDKHLDDLAGGDEAQPAVALVRWATLLCLVRVGGDGKMHLNSYVAELIMRA